VNRDAVVEPEEKMTRKEKKRRGGAFGKGGVERLASTSMWLLRLR
jgi:hypothetical protein